MRRGKGVNTFSSRDNFSLQQRCSASDDGNEWISQKGKERAKKMFGKLSISVLAFSLVGGCTGPQMVVHQIIPDSNGGFFNVDTNSQDPYQGITVDELAVEDCIARSTSALVAAGVAASEMSVDPLKKNIVGAVVQYMQSHGQITVCASKPSSAFGCTTFGCSSFGIVVSHRPRDLDNINCSYWQYSSGNNSQVSNTDNPFKIPARATTETSPEQSNQTRKCVVNSECPEGQYCNDGSCKYDCKVDRDCAAGTVCDTRNGKCVAGAGAPPPSPAPIQPQPSGDTLVY